LLTTIGECTALETSKLEDICIRMQKLEHHALTRVVIVLIGGCSRSGKTVLAKEVVKYFSRRKIPSDSISLDSWLIDIDKRPEHSSVLERYDCAAIIADINRILNGKSIMLSYYDPKTRSRLIGRSSAYHLKNGLLIIEGVIALALEGLRMNSLFNIYVTCDDVTRFSRLKDYYCIFKGVELHDALKILCDREKEEVPFVHGTNKWADIIFKNGSMTK